MPTTLITGSGKGLGFETARRLAEDGHSVYVTDRDTRLGEEAAARIGARFLPLDVTDEDSVKAAVEQVREDAGHLDVLVNNAGIAGSRKPVGETTAADLRATYDTNVFGVVRVTHAFLPLLQTSDNAVVVNVGSGLGSPAAHDDPARPEFQVLMLDYNSSKTALVMITAQYAKAFPGIRFNTVDPGYTATDFNGNTGLKTVQQGAEIIVRMARIGADGPTGGFFDEDGPVVW
ncbi:SDR family NAD(P)-dependent oxidoreductase [Streptomyces sp. NPDC047043]|uniref:SDR family NAD(P)-dependent oxidoreductase n=1 Tax=unclassified Streptomyces TaxID=2593676 RepID=UPI0033F1D3D6